MDETRKWHIAKLCALGLFVSSGATEATERGNTHADLAFIDTLAGVPLPPGFYVRDDINYNLSNRLNDQNGNKVQVRAGPFNFPVKFYAASLADVITLAWVPELKIPYINASLTTAAYGFYAVSRAEAQTNVFGNITGIGETRRGRGDITFVPAAFGWSFPERDIYFTLAPFDFTAPTGNYIGNDIIGNTPGLNYWSYRPALLFTYLNAAGQEISINAGLSTNSENYATHYTSGSEIYFTWVAQQHFSLKLSLGLEGYYYVQYTNDIQNGEVVGTAPTFNPLISPDPLNSGPGNRGESFAIGPTISYTLTKHIFANFHYVRDVFSYNRKVNNAFWARVAIRF